VYDVDGNGFITRDELSNVLMVLGFGENDEVSSPNPTVRLETVFEAMDTNMDGLISFEEFKVTSSKRWFLEYGYSCHSFPL
jgi:Ca2+-binding EF-hand superfamily protein